MAKSKAFESGAIADVFRSIASAPIGTQDGEVAFRVPLNSTKDVVRVRVRNHSATMARQFLKEAISFERGGEQYAAEEAKAGRQVELSVLRKAHFDFGKDVSIYDKAVVAVDAILTWDDKKYLVPAIDAKTGENSPWIDVPDGVYDLYMGNYDRLHSPDPRERSQELARVAGRRRDVCIHDERGRQTNPFGYLEFQREVIEPIPVAVDEEQVYSGRLVEV